MIRTADVCEHCDGPRLYIAGNGLPGEAIATRVGFRHTSDCVETDYQPANTPWICAQCEGGNHKCCQPVSGYRASGEPLRCECDCHTEDKQPAEETKSLGPMLDDIMPSNQWWRNLPSRHCQQWCDRDAANCLGVFVFDGEAHICPTEWARQEKGYQPVSTPSADQGWQCPCCGTVFAPCISACHCRTTPVATDA